MKREHFQEWTQCVQMGAAKVETEWMWQKSWEREWLEEMNSSVIIIFLPLDSRKAKFWCNHYIQTWP